MSPLTKNIIGVSIIAATVGTVLLVDGPVGVDVSPVESTRVDQVDSKAQTTKTADVSPGKRLESKLGMSNGVVVAYVPRGAADGGDLVLDSFPCVRRRAGSKPTSCLRRFEADGGAEDFGELNRFLASMAVGADCEPVACSIWAGDKP